MEKEFTQGEELLATNLTMESVKRFERFLEDKRWTDTVGFALFPTNTKDWYSLFISSHLSHSWRHEIKEEIIAFFDGLDIHSSLE